MARIQQPISNVWKWVLGIAGIACLCLVYESLSNAQHKRNPADTTIPNLTQLANGFVQVCTPKNNDLKAAFGIEDDSETIFDKIGNTRIYEDSVATYGRLFKGLVWGCMLSFVAGIIMGCYEWVAALLLPPLAFLAKVPGTAMLAVFFVMVGTGESMFTAMIGFGVLPTLTQSIYLAAKNEVHEEEINKAYTLGASNFEVIWNVVVRQTMPNVLESVRLQIGPAMVYLIAAEMLVGQVGMGYQIRMQQRLLNMAVVYDYIILLGASGLLMDRMMMALRQRLCPWYDYQK
jgi:NitT/TauT family transport system permease protein